MTEKTNTAAAQAPASLVKILPENISNDVKQKAVDALNAAYDAYHEKGGIMDLQKQVADRLERSVAYQALVLAREAVNLSKNDAGVPDMRVAGPAFKALCTIGETHLRSKHAVNGTEPSIAELLPNWANYKSGHARSLERGFDPTAVAPIGGAPVYPTASKFITASKDTNPAAPGEKAPSSKAATLYSVEQEKFSALLAAAHTTLLEAMRTCKTEEQSNGAANIISKAAGAIHTFVKEHPFVAQATSEEETVPASPAARKEQRKRGGSK